MSIKFICRCGKHLRARDDMAARRSVCPRCGAPVGVPTLQPTVRGATLGPMSPAERIQARQAAPPLRRSPPTAPSTWSEPPANAPGECPVVSLPAADVTPESLSVQPSPRDATTQLVLQVRRRRWWYRQEIEKHWYDCLLYPLRAGPLLLGLSMALTAISGGSTLALPHLLRGETADPSWLFGICSLAFLILVLLSYGPGFLDCVLLSARDGEIRRIRWPGRDVGLAIKSGVRWLLCFAKGPLVAVGASLLFWLHGGDLTSLDWLLVAEANILALSCWLLLVWSDTEEEAPHTGHAQRVGNLVQRLGHGLVVVAGCASLLALGHAWLIGLALEAIHSETGFGWLLLWLVWGSSLFFATFLFRWVGVWLYWERLRGKGTKSLPEPSPTAQEK